MKHQVVFEAPLSQELVERLAALGIVKASKEEDTKFILPEDWTMKTETHGGVRIFDEHNQWRVVETPAAGTEFILRFNDTVGFQPPSDHFKPQSGGFGVNTRGGYFVEAPSF